MGDKSFEGWCPVLGYEGLYEVSSQGRVRRIGRAARAGKGRGGGVVRGRILTSTLYRKGYRKVQLWRDGCWRNVGIHQLVAAVFIGPCPKGHEINHKDGVKHNNCTDNLEYVTRSGNVKHAYMTGLRKPTDGHKIWETRRRHERIRAGV